MSRKRRHDEPMADENKPTSPFMPMFEHFKAELDEHHDRRERVIKASRDITGASKKIIFSLQRVRKLKASLPPFVAKTNKPHDEAIQAQYKAITADLQGLNAWRYARNITGGNQEFMEAVTFRHYLEAQTLISFEEAQARIDTMCRGTVKSEDAEFGRESVQLTISDYILGVFDMVGEIMRFAITTMATTSELPSTDGRSVLTDLRELRSMLESLEVDNGVPLERDISKKMGVMQICVEKVENAWYGLTVRGAERPKGWMPDISQARGGEEIEGY